MEFILPTVLWEDPNPTIYTRGVGVSIDVSTITKVLEVVNVFNVRFLAKDRDM